MDSAQTVKITDTWLKQGAQAVAQLTLQIHVQILLGLLHVQPYMICAENI